MFNITMKIKALVLAAVAFIGIGMVSCSSKEEAAPQETVISVDSLMSEPSALVGDTIEIKGLCSHLCSHGARKAFLLGADSTTIIRCEATPEMGGAFALDAKGKELTVRGIVRESRIGEAEVAAMEARYAAADSAANKHEACETEKKAQGQDSIDTFAARMADYRTKIAARTEAEGKDYLSFYYIEALSYTIDNAEAAE